MALPVVLLKAKSAISKGAKAVKTAKAVKSVTSNSNEEGVKSFLGVLKTPLIIVNSIAGPLADFVFVVFFAIVAIPQILVGTIYGGGSLSDSFNSSGNSGAASSVVECARQQIGKPYVFGAEGPDSFDCSGLVAYCYRQALGVEVPHYTKSLATSNLFETVTSADELSAGDIILDGGNNIGHVGIYSGNGTVIHSAIKTEYGLSGIDGVQEESLQDYCDYHGGFEVYRRYKG